MLNLRKAKALVAAVALVTSSIITLNAKPAQAYASFEQPYWSGLNFTGMTNRQADQWCRDNISRAIRTYYLNNGGSYTVLPVSGGMEYNTNRIMYVWAHLNNRQCVANIRGL